jgi:hypothetical protein
VDTAIIAALAEEAAVESFIATTAATTHVYVYFEKGNNILAEASTHLVCHQDAKSLAILLIKYYHHTQRSQFHTSNVSARYKHVHPEHE